MIQSMGSGAFRLKVCASMILGATCVSCTTLTGPESRPSIFVGILRLKPAPKSDGAVASSTTALGAAAGLDAAFIGFRKSTRISADPAKCQILILVRSDAELEETTNLLKSLERGSSVCVRAF